jgi:hypothetical protein
MKYGPPWICIASYWQLHHAIFQSTCACCCSGRWCSRTDQSFICLGSDPPMHCKYRPAFCASANIYLHSVARMRHQSAAAGTMPIDGPGKLPLHEHHLIVDICSLCSGLMQPRRPIQYDPLIFHRHICQPLSFEPNINSIFDSPSD